RPEGPPGPGEARRPAPQYCEKRPRQRDSHRGSRVCLPGLERAAGNLEQLGCLPMGEPLSLQIAIALKQFSASGSLPAWVTIVVASLRILDDCAYVSPLLLASRTS